MYRTQNGGTAQGAQAVVACLHSATAPLIVLQFTVLF